MVARALCSKDQLDDLMFMVMQNMDVTRLQFRRVKSDLEEVRRLERAFRPGFHASTPGERKVLAHEPQELRTTLFADISMLLHSIHRTNELLQQLKRLMPQDPEVASIRNRHRRWLRSCEEFKALLDRFDLGDYGELQGSVFCMNGKSFDLGTDLESKADRLFRDIVAVWERASEKRRRIRELISRKEVCS